MIFDFSNLLLKRAEKRLAKLERTQSKDQIKIQLIFRNGKIKEITVNSKEINNE